MPRLIDGPSAIEAAGNPAKIIREYVGAVNTGTRAVSVAHMQSPAGWEEPGQRPDFDEFTVVLEVRRGQAVHTAPGEWVRYRSPTSEGAEYVAVCLPAFTPETAHRDD